MPVKINAVGKRYGRLVVLHEGPKTRVGVESRVQWVCRCDCGNEATFIGSNLRAGHAKSCGCLSPDRRKWTAKDLAYLREWYGGKSCLEIGDYLGRTARAIALKAFQAGISAHPTIVSPADEADYFSMIHEIAGEAGLNPAKAMASLKRGYPHIRAQAWQRLRERRLTYKYISAISGFDHSTIMHAVGRLAERQREAVE